ncbi:hypothetical protein Cylst_0194 [Cylindrospermum stagnale PCC 7417]|uniref:Uncharacterized protein n=1 Tax=Cylindrospermum stagnale PCC 7417 TaxID=56107 RepID=K9WQE0_9NOST|nr:hypothetical protein [Cylindrospermum stagnale]AFZ22570.1 hypothetical protein Cylst_0194 [Cylindrospermum stagnale PCC 7417]
MLKHHPTWMKNLNSLEDATGGDTKSRAEIASYGVQIVGYCAFSYTSVIIFKQQLSTEFTIRC